MGVGHGAHCGADGDVPAGGVGGQGLDGFGADAPGRGVDDAAQADFVVGVVDDAEVAEGVLDFAAVVEADAADQPVGDALAEALVLKGAALGVDAVHNGAVAGAVLPGAGQAGDFVHGPGGFVLLAVGFVEGNGAAGGVAGVKGPLNALGVGGDDAGGGVEDIFGGTVVFAQADDGSVGEVGLEA